MQQGDEIHGSVNSADASAGVEIPVYPAGGNVARVIAADEMLCITDLELVSAPGGACHVFIGADATPGTGETVTRGTVGATGGIVRSWVRTPRMGIRGGKPFVIAPAGVVDVNFTGFIKKA